MKNETLTLIQNKIKEGIQLKEIWYSDVEQLVKDSKIKMFYKIENEGFATSVGYLVTTDNEVLLMKHKINDVITSFVIEECYREFPEIKNNFMRMDAIEFYDY